MTGFRVAGCDCHVHVVAPLMEAPMVASRTYTAPPAPLSALQGVAAGRGVTRFVVVQPSFYGTDNRVTLGAIEALGSEGRGVAVIDPARTDAGSLAAFHRAGIRGLRINLYSTLAAQSATPLDALFGAQADVAAGMGWHVEVLAALPVLAQHAAMLAASPAPVVIDHFGLYAGFAPDSAPALKTLALLREAHVWMKLSAPYRASPDPLATRPDRAWLAAILDAAGPRCVWGSDWPHTPPHEQQTGGGIALPYRALEYGAVVDGFRGAVTEVAGPALAEAIMTDHAAELYGFDGGDGDGRHATERDP